MRKKDLYDTNQKIMAQLQSVKAELEDLRNENKRLLLELKQIKETPKEQEISAKETVKENEEMVLEEDFIYASKIIGKIVVSAAKCCNKLSLPPNTAQNKELINLILGRTEVAKAQILKILNSENSFEDKKMLIDNEEVTAEDYFGGIMAQN